MNANQMPLTLDPIIEMYYYEADAGDNIYFDPFLNEWMPLVEDK